MIAPVVYYSSPGARRLAEHCARAFFLHPHKNLLSTEEAAAVIPIVQMKKPRLPQNHRGGAGRGRLRALSEAHAEGLLCLEWQQRERERRKGAQPRSSWHRRQRQDSNRDLQGSQSTIRMQTRSRHSGCLRSSRTHGVQKQGAGPWGGIYLL